MTARFLINDDGAPFKSAEIGTLRTALDSLDYPARKNYRNQNADAIAQHPAVKFLIVSGPGTGKSHLFLDRIRNWYQQDPEASIVVTSFVRKLVADLQSDIDEKLTAEQNRRITVMTLHKYARSIVERNRGTMERPLGKHFRIIGQSWKEMVWNDVLAFHGSADQEIRSWKKFEEQLHNNCFEDSDEWWNLKKTYFNLCRFYNAAGFADLILRAADALAENPALNESSYFIIDEYQDFNSAEEALLNQLAAGPRGLLIVGDDEQVLYEKLKSGKPTLIRSLYGKADFANGMLPFCNRSSYHITKTADHFIRQHKEDGCIEKIYLPLNPDDEEPKVRVIACAAPSTAVDYIENFISNHKAEIDERKQLLTSGDEKDAFLLILTPVRVQKVEKVYGQKPADRLKKIVAQYQAETRSYSEDYFKLLTYRSLEDNPHSNFTFRKVLFYEDVPDERAHELIALAWQSGKSIGDLATQEVEDTLKKCNAIKTIIEGEDPGEEKLEQIHALISISDDERLLTEIEHVAASEEETARLEHEEEEQAELEEIEAKPMGAVELLTIVGAKGLSADHVIIIGFDNVNMGYVTKNAFYVAMTRARKSLHILTALKSRGARKAHGFLDQLPDQYMEFYKCTKKGISPLRGRWDFEGFLDYVSKEISTSRSKR